jgi:hypothetical protein
MLSMLPVQAAPAHPNMSSGIVTTVMESHLPPLCLTNSQLHSVQLYEVLLSGWAGGAEKKNYIKEQT